MCALYLDDVGRNSIACDSSSLISLADCCYLGVLEELRRHLDGDFLITQGVKRESIDRPLRMKSHTLTAVRLQRAVNEGVLRVVSPPRLGEIAKELLWMANNIFFISGRPLHILHRGEAEAVAMAHELALKNVLIDERTTRMLIEDPYSMRDHYEREFNAPVRMNKKYLSRFEELTRGLEIIRSSELLIIAYEKGYFKRYGSLERMAIESSLYGIKFAGCAISFSEIEDYLKGL